MRNAILYNTCMRLVNFLSGTRFFHTKRKILRIIGICVGNNTKIVGPITVSRAATLKIGDNVWIGKGFEIYGNGKVFIGDNCDFGPDVTFFTGSHEIGDKKRRAGKGIKFEYSIGRGNWIGGKTSFLNGASLEDSNVVAANSLITKNFNSNLLIMGNPATIKKNFSQ